MHRDPKPGNMILAADGPRIIDFGIARAVDATAGIIFAVPPAAQRPNE